MNGAVGKGMRKQLVPEHAKRGQDIALLRWPDAQQMGLHGIDVRLVDGAPQIHEITQGLCYLGYETLKAPHCGLVLPPPTLSQPEGSGKVEQRYHGLNAARKQRAQNVPIAGDCAVIPSSLIGLDAAPFNGEPQRILAHGLGQLKILLIAPLPPLASA